MSPQEDREMQAWAEEVRRRSDFIEDAQDKLAGSVEFQTLAHAYAATPASMRAEALRQMADFAVLFVVRQEAQNGQG